MRGLELARYALENAWRSRLRTVLTIAGIAIASGALVSMVGFILGLKQQIELPIQKLGLLNNIEVKPASDAETSSSSPRLDEDALTRLEAIDGVEFAYPDFRLSEVSLARGEHTEKTFAMGLPREAGLVGLSQELLLAGSFFSVGDRPEVVIGSRLVSSLGFESPQSAIGQHVLLSAGGLVAKGEKQFEYQDEELQLTVAGVYQPPRFATSLSDDAILLPVDLMRRMPPSWMESGLQQLRSLDGERVVGYPRIVVRATSPAEVMRVQRKIEDLGFSAVSVMDRMEEMKRFFVFMEVLLSAVGTVALVVAGLGILNTLTMTVMERYQEIGIYKAIGASHGDIRLMFLVEAGAVGFVGGIAGLGLARFVSWILAYAFNAYAARQGVDGPEAVFFFPWWLLAGSVLYSVTISIVSGLYPASRAANIDPIQALRRG